MKGLAKRLGPRLGFDVIRLPTRRRGLGEAFAQLARAEYRPVLERIARSVAAEHVLAAASSKEGSISFRVAEDDPEAVCLEVSLFEFYPGAPGLGEVVAFMGQRGFATYDIVGGHERPLDGALAQIDLVFVREDGVCRKSSRYRA